MIFVIAYIFLSTRNRVAFRDGMEKRKGRDGLGLCLISIFNSHGTIKYFSNECPCWVLNL